MTYVSYFAIRLYLREFSGQTADCRRPDKPKKENFLNAMECVNNMKKC